MINETKISDFPSRLKYLIGKSGDTNKVFAKNCGIKEKQLYIYLKGDSEPGMKALRGIKLYYPAFSIDWLISGEGIPILEAKNAHSDVINIQHGQVIEKFKDKQYALELNQNLVTLESLSIKEFYKVGGYVEAAINHARIDESNPDEDLLNGTTSKK